MPVQPGQDNVTSANSFLKSFFDKWGNSPGSTPIELHACANCGLTAPKMGLSVFNAIATAHQSGAQGVYLSLLQALGGVVQQEIRISNLGDVGKFLDAICIKQCPKCALELCARCSKDADAKNGCIMCRANMQAATIETSIQPNLKDPSITRPVEDLVSHVKISRPGTYQFLRNDSTNALAEEIGALHRQYPGSPELHYAYAAALQLNLLGETADKVLDECVKAHPTFWIAELTKRRNSLFAWNPLACPKLDLVPGAVIHDSINSILTRALLLTTRQGMLPRAVVYQRDDSFDSAALQNCKMQFLTMISPVTDPQVVAINACIWDNPSDPYRTEILACPFAKWSDAQRFSYELFVRQNDFDFVIVDHSGRVKYARSVTPSARMQAAHQQLAQMFDTSEGQNLAESVQAVRRHTSMVNPNNIAY